MSKKMILIGLVACSAIRVDNVEASEFWRRGESAPRGRASSAPAVGASWAASQTQPEAPVAQAQQPFQQGGSDISEKLDAAWTRAVNIHRDIQEYGLKDSRSGLVLGIFVDPQC